MHFFRLTAVRLVLTLSLPLGIAPASAQEGALSQLYAARPPAGSSFVRVVNPLPGQLVVRVAEGPSQRIGDGAPASSYAVVPGGRNFVVQVDNRPAATLEVAPNSFKTLVLRRDGSKFAFTAIDDTTDTQDALKAELRLYNLSEGCSSAQLLLSPVGTPVLRDVSQGAAAARLVNPARASLVGQCGSATTASQALPELQPGDHLSLFLTGSAAKPILTLQPSRTDAFKR